MTSRTHLGRRNFIAGAASLLAAASLPARAQSQAKQLRIGYQKAANTLVLLKANGALEQALHAQGTRVSWTEFPAGPQLLEGLNVGAIDFGYVGEAPPVFAQAAGADFVYSAYEIATPHAEGVVVPQHSPIKSVADLKGKKIAFNKGSDVHWFIVALLSQNHIAYSDITPVFLPPADARAALESGAVDAWAIWDPFLAAVTQQGNARLLVDAQGVVSHHQFFLSARSFARQSPDVLRITLEQVGAQGQRIRANRAQAAAQLAPIQGLPASVIEVGLEHYAHIFKPVDAPILAEQQRIADAFFDLKLIPKRIVTRDAVL
jgi:sulfonate transport system substrate-binding protein